MGKNKYQVGLVARKCGHQENAGEITSSCGYEPKVKQWETEKLCKACVIEANQGHQARIEAMRLKAVEYCKAHNIPTEISNITAYDNNAEIIIYIK